MNNWCVSGYLGHDPKLRTLPSGTLVLNLSIAVKQRQIKSKDGQWVDQAPVWTDITMFGGACQWLSQRLTKGSHIEAVGELGMREYEARDGTKRTQIELFATKINPLDKREGETRDAARSGGSGAGKSYDKPYTRDEAPPFDDDDAIPF